MTRVVRLQTRAGRLELEPFTGWNEPMGELHHECGVAAVYHAAGTTVSSLAPIAGDVNSVARLVPRMLLDMQNRGQLAAGMSSFRPDRSALIKTHKEVGTVAEAFRLNHREEFEAIMEGVDGPLAIGHVRYATCGGNDRNDAQPFERDHGRKTKWFAFAFNGQLANYEASRMSCWPRATTTSSETPTPKSSCTRWPTSSRPRTRIPTGSASSDGSRNASTVPTTSS